jgi:hypothetical protein
MVTVMCERCAELEEALAAAKRALGEIESAGDLVALRKWFGLSRGLSRIALRLYRAKTRYLPAWIIADELINPEGDPSTVKTQIYHLRQKLGREAVECMDGAGYRLSPDAYLRISQAMNAGA